MISETITFNFETEEQQKRFHKVLNGTECVSIDATSAQKIKQIYGLLWNVDTDRRMSSGVAVSEARKIALSMIDKDGQAEGIGWARDKIQSASANEGSA